MATLPPAYGAGSIAGSFPADGCIIGWADYNDTATTATPINIPALTPTKLTNDGLGAQSSSLYLPSGISDIWNSTTNQFDFTGLNLGDMIDIRVDAVLTTTVPNQNFRLALVAGIGGFEYEIPFAGGIVKNAGAVGASRYNGLYIGNTNTRDNPAEFRIYSDDPATVVVNGWWCKVLLVGQR